MVGQPIFSTWIILMPFSCNLKSSFCLFSRAQYDMFFFLVFLLFLALEYRTFSTARRRFIVKRINVSNSKFQVSMCQFVLIEKGFWERWRGFGVSSFSFFRLFFMGWRCGSVRCSGRALQKVVDMRPICCFAWLYIPFVLQNCPWLVTPFITLFPQIDTYFLGHSSLPMISIFKLPHQVTGLNQVSSVNIKCWT